VSIIDFARYDDDGVNWRVVEGLGTTIAAHAAGVAAVLDCPVQCIAHSGGRLANSTERRLYLAFKCPSDSMPRRVTNYPPRSYAINQSKWTYGLDDSMASQHPNKGYKAPWSAGATGPDGFSDGQCVQQQKLSAVPNHVWIMGENWGQSTVYSLADTPVVTSNGGGIGNDAVIGTWSYATMDTSPARFHAPSWGGGKYQSFNNGGNYAYADGHVEFLALKDLLVHSPASDEAYKNPFNNQPYSLMEDHWKWKKLR